MNDIVFSIVVVAFLAPIVCMAAPTAPVCKPQSEKPVSGHKELRAYVQDTGSYIPLTYQGRMMQYSTQINGTVSGNATIKTDCGDIMVSIVINEEKESLTYHVDKMTYSKGQIQQSCKLHAIEAGKQGEKQYSCGDIPNPLLIIEKLDMMDEVLCLNSKKTKLCKLYWAEQ